MHVTWKLYSENRWNGAHKFASLLFSYLMINDIYLPNNCCLEQRKLFPSSLYSWNNISLSRSRLSENLWRSSYGIISSKCEFAISSKLSWNFFFASSFTSRITLCSISFLLAFFSNNELEGDQFGLLDDWLYAVNLKEISSVFVRNVL